MQSVCKACGQPIWGTSLSALGATWHPEHFLCTVCGRPISGTTFQVYQDAPCHLECFRDRIAPRCAYCGKPLLTGYLVDQWGTKYCKEHRNQYPRCAYCARLVPPHEQEPGAEAMRCPICRSTAIETAEVAKPIFSQLIKWISAQGLRYNSLPIKLELCGRAKLANYLRERNHTHSLGATMSTTYTQDGHVVRTEVSGVAVLYGLSSTLFQGVTIHELGHVWLIVQDIQNMPDWAVEGFCELLSHRYYSGLNTPESRYHSQALEENPDPIYGDGFRRMHTISDKIGFQRLITTMQETKRLPMNS